jgi:hypothetical protein
MSKANDVEIAVAKGGLLERERIIAKPGFNRWLVPPAALAIHLCIGMAYGFSVFWAAAVARGRDCDWHRSAGLRRQCDDILG